MAKNGKKNKSGSGKKRIKVGNESFETVELGKEADSDTVSNDSIIVEPVSNSGFFSGGTLSAASIVLTVAAGLSILMALLAANLPSGKEAVLAFAGFGLGSEAVPARTIQWLRGLDMLFPAFCAGGLALFFSGFQKRGNRPIVRLVLLALLFAFIADMAENSAVMNLAGARNTGGMFLSTYAKYGLIVFAFVVGSAVVDTTSPLGKVVMLVLRFVLPIVFVVLVSGLAGTPMLALAALIFVLSLFLFAVFAQTEAG